MLPLHEDSRTGSFSKQVLKPESVTDTYTTPPHILAFVPSVWNAKVKYVFFSSEFFLFCA